MITIMSNKYIEMKNFYKYIDTEIITLMDIGGRQYMPNVFVN